MELELAFCDWKGDLVESSVKKEVQGETRGASVLGLSRIGMGRFVESN